MIACSASFAMCSLYGFGLLTSSPFSKAEVVVLRTGSVRKVNLIAKREGFLLKVDSRGFDALRIVQRDRTRSREAVIASILRGTFLARPWDQARLNNAIMEECTSKRSVSVMRALASVGADPFLPKPEYAAISDVCLSSDRLYSGLVLLGGVFDLKSRIKRHGSAPLVAASAQSSIKCLKYLIAKGADPFSEYSIIVSAGTDIGAKPFVYNAIEASCLVQADDPERSLAVTKYLHELYGCDSRFPSQKRLLSILGSVAWRFERTPGPKRDQFHAFVSWVQREVE